jgi:hypothetical protein
VVSGSVGLNMMMATQLLIDTNVLIDYSRDYPEVASYVRTRQDHLLPRWSSYAKVTPS